MKIRKTIFTTALFTLVCFGLCQQVQSATDTPDPGSVGGSFSTADGINALRNNSGAGNSAFGWWALFTNTDASFNTAVGAGALLSNTDGSSNTAVGTVALLLNTTGSDNNAVGTSALVNNTTGSFNNAFGRAALSSNVDGGQNNAFGDLALSNNTSGSGNTAVGDDALFFCTTGSSNVAVGDEAGNSIVDAVDNVIVGTGAGGNIVSNGNNIYIGTAVTGPGDETRFIRIGDTGFTDYDCFIAGIFGRGIDAGTATIVGIDADQKLGTVLVNANGNRVPFKPQAMVDESLKQQKRIAELEGTVERLASMVNEQAAQIQKVSAQLELNKPAPKTVANK